MWPIIVIFISLGVVAILSKLHRVPHSTVYSSSLRLFFKLQVYEVSWHERCTRVRPAKRTTQWTRWGSIIWAYVCSQTLGVNKLSCSGMELRWVKIRRVKQSLGLLNTDQNGLDKTTKILLNLEKSIFCCPSAKKLIFVLFAINIGWEMITNSGNAIGYSK